MDVQCDREALTRWANDSVAFYGLDLERVSTLLLAQLEHVERNRIISVYSVTDELKAMEGKGRMTPTKQSEPFEKGVLAGLHRKHYMDARFVAMNLASEFGLVAGRDGNKVFTNLIGKIFHEHKGEDVGGKFSKRLADEVTVATFERRVERRQVTGEWIIFAKHQKKNYYLTLARHQESNEAIREKADFAIRMDFPFLKVLFVGGEY